MKKNSTTRKTTVAKVEPETVLDEGQERAIRAVNDVLNTPGIPTCVKRAWRDVLQKTAKIAGVEYPGVEIWNFHDDDEQNLNPKLMLEVFESDAVKAREDLYGDRPSKKDPETEKAEWQALRNRQRRLMQLILGITQNDSDTAGKLFEFLVLTGSMDQDTPVGSSQFSDLLHELYAMSDDCYKNFRSKERQLTAKFGGVQ